MDPLLERGEELAALEAVVGGGARRARPARPRGRRGRDRQDVAGARAAGAARAARAFLLGACEPLSVPVPLGAVARARRRRGVGARRRRRARPRPVAARRAARAGAGGRRARGRPLGRPGDAGRAAPAGAPGRGRRRRGRRHLSRRRGRPPTPRWPCWSATSSPAPRPGAWRCAPLSHAAVRSWPGPRTSTPPSCARLTGGNPFLVVEALAAGGGLPSSVRDATLARVGRLGPGARGVVDAAAVIGQRVPPSFWPRSIPAQRTAVEEALAHGVLTDDGATPRLPPRAHPPGDRERDLRAAPGRAARARSSPRSRSGPPAEPARLAHHAERAGLAAEAAATPSSRQRRPSASARCARPACSSIAPCGSAGAGDAERFELLLRFSRAANFAGAHARPALDAAEEAVALARARADARARRARAERARRGAVVARPRRGGAEAAARRRIAALEPTDDLAELARAHAALVRMEAVAFDPAAAIAAAARALELAARAAGSRTCGSTSTISLARRPGLSRRAGRARAAGRGARRCRARPGCTSRSSAPTSTRSRWQPSPRPRHGRRARARGARAASTSASCARPAEYMTVVLGAQPARPRPLGRGARARRGAPAAAGTAGSALAHMVEGARRGLAAATRAATRCSREAAEALAGVPEGARHGLIRAALAEAAWLRGDRAAMREHALAGLRGAHADQFARSAGELALWAAPRRRRRSQPPPPLPEPVRLELEGDWRGAIARVARARRALRGRARRAAGRRARRARGGGGAAAARRGRRGARASPATAPQRGRRGAARAAPLDARQRGRADAPRAGGARHVAGGRHQRRHRGARCTSPSAPSSTTSPRSSRKLGAPTRTAAVDAARAGRRAAGARWVAPGANLGGRADPGAQSRT